MDGQNFMIYEVFAHDTSDTCWLRCSYVIVVYRHISILRKNIVVGFAFFFIINLFANNNNTVIIITNRNNRLAHCTEPVITTANNCLFSKCVIFSHFRCSIFGHLIQSIYIIVWNKSNRCETYRMPGYATVYYSFCETMTKKNCFALTAIESHGLVCLIACNCALYSTIELSSMWTTFWLGFKNRS